MEATRNDSGSFTVEQEELFAALLRERGITDLEESRIPRRAAGAVCELSFAQSRLWFLEQLEPQSGAYNIPIGLRIRGELASAALEQSLQAIVDRHEVLRTVFEQQDDRVVQQVSASLRLPVAVRDLMGLPVEDRERELRRLMNEDAQGAFDLSQGPLLRATIIQLADTDNVLLLTFHHAVADAWSIEIFVRELTALYEAFRRGARSSLPELPIQYADFSQWQRDSLTGERLEQLLAYWREHLRDAPPWLDLRAGRAINASRGTRGAVLSRVLDPSLAGSLRELAASRDATLFIVLLAAFKALLARYSQSSDIVVGTPIANRQREELEPLIGFFVNTLALRTDVSGDPSFAELLERVRHVALDGHAHQDMPFERLVEDLAPDRSRGRTPLFQVMFVLRTASVAAPAPLPALAFEWLEFENRTAKFDLTLQVDERNDGGLGASFEYSTDLYDEPTVARLLEHYERLLQSVVSAPGRRLSEVELLTEAEVSQLREWGGVAGSPQTSIVSRFELQVAAAPDAAAVGHLTYGDLDRSANRLARRLAMLGVGRESRVVICVSEPADFVCSVLAVLKAGSAYVPLDPAYPAERLRYLLTDSDPAVLIVDHGAPAVLRESTVPRVEVSEPLDFPDGPLDITVFPEQLAYVMYTSGSTGLPKGVACTHGGVVNLIEDMNRRAPLPSRHRGSVFSNVSFDASVYEMFAGLLTGGSLHWVPAELRADPEGLARWQSEARIESAYIPPFLLAQWSQGAPLLQKMQRLFVGVEPIEERLLRALRVRIPSLRIINAYGPTESTVVAAAYDIPASGDEADLGAAPIGTPVRGLTALVLDAAGSRVPIGVSGELHVGGAGLARAYWRRPALTAERFVPADGGQRLYRTGDGARWRADGQLEFLGRVDEQVKVRGYRIEPAEIERVLLREPGVRRALVLAEAERSGTRRLVAYLEADAKVDLAAVRRAVKAGLPEFMAPSAYVVLDAFPQTTHGKIDRAALPAPPVEIDPRTHQPPRTPLEEKLCAIWGDVLQRPQVGITDNFFDLGGHSLLATQVISRIRTALEIDLPLQSLFEEPTVATLAHGIEAQRWSKSAYPAPALQALERTAEPQQRFAQSFAQQRLWFLEQLEPGTSTYNISNAIRLRGELDFAAFERSLQALVERHEALRTTFALVDVGLVQNVHADASLALSKTNLQALDISTREAQLAVLLEQEAQRPFDLERGPLMRVAVWQLDAREHVVLFTIHHIITDGWSIGVLVKELSALYAAFIQEQPSPLAPLTIQYADYSQWQLDWLQFGVLEALLFHWQERLRDAPPMIDLPTDFPRGPLHSSRGADVGITLDPPLAIALRDLARRHDATLFMVMLAAFSALLGRYSGQDDIVVGTPIAGRPREELEPLIGFFVNTLVLRTDLSGNPSFHELLGRVRDDALGAYAHQDLPFEKLVEQLSPERRWARTPLFQVMFVLQNAPSAPLELPGLDVSVVPLTNQTAKFDLMMQVQEEADGGLTVACQYSSDLFLPATLERFIGHYRKLLESVVRTPRLPLAELPLLSADEHDALVNRLGVGERVPRDELPLQRRFSDCVARWPELLAVADERRRVTYQELEQRSNQLARHLQLLGVTRESRVALCLEPSVEFVEGVLAVLKAGGAYVPLDRKTPAERLRHLIESSGACIVLTDDVLTGVPSDVLLLSPGDRAIGAHSTAAIDVPVEVDNLAYVIYTSGSTGTPKGVACTHGAVANVIADIVSRAPLDPGHAASGWTSVSFDVSVYELFAALLHGASLHWVPDAVRIQPRELCAWLADNRIESAYLPPFLLPGVLAWMKEEANTPLVLQRVLVGVEPIRERQLTDMMAALPGLRIINGYGPTETTICATLQEVNPAAERGAAIVPIGRAVSNLHLYVLDGEGRVVPCGVSGELYVGGAGLARGYWGQPALTAERFVPSAFIPGERLYRTGDRVRYRADGSLEFLGRDDDQVKVRGHRVEPGEIEAALVLQPGVRRSVVLARSDASGEKRLVAYVEHATDATLEATTLRSALRERLPEFMIPSVFMILPALPETPSGKVDRRALPNPEGIRSRVSEVTEAPRDELEKQLVSMWERLLNYNPIGIMENFFDVGGHSLLALHMQGEVRQKFGVDFPLTELFDHPTIVNLAEYIRTHSRGTTGSATNPAGPTRTVGIFERLRRGWRNKSRSRPTTSRGAPDELVAMRTGGSRAPLFLIHPVTGTVLCYAELVRHLSVDQPCYGLQVTIPPGQAVTVESLAERHISTLRRVQAHGPYSLGGWSFGGVVAFEMARQLRLAGEYVSWLGLIDSFPHDASAREKTDAQILTLFVEDWVASAGEVVSLTVNDLGHAQQLLTARGLLPETLSPEQFRERWQVYQANYKAGAWYRPSTHAGRISLIMGAEAFDDRARVPMRSWGPVAAGGLHIEVLPGSHYELLREPLVRTTAATLDALLEAMGAQPRLHETKMA